MRAGGTAPAGGGTSLMLALLAAASRAGSWCAVVGLPALGALAAAESGIALERLALVPEPGSDWPTVVAALIDGVDVVVTAVPGAVSGTVVSRLAARARQRGCVLVPFGDWAGADVTLQVSSGRWEGLGDGWGRLRRREVTVLANGRGAAARPRELTLWMPGVTTRPGRPETRSTAPRERPGPSAVPDNRPLHAVPSPPAGAADPHGGRQERRAAVRTGSDGPRTRFQAAPGSAAPGLAPGSAAAGVAVAAGAGVGD
ncbi:hypothetical protein Asi03nite_32740 [Actinoplanes siamensis]|uniref:Uncharacterized protein n=1 Tax=Actinoplanes siamensis TaxID=1223317 RepID=A0A919TK68_9ACTN|nr:hypothetical protein Asi03nite_32740 [Actinoplanes siamensis]